MSVFNDLMKGKTKLCVVGLGYVGLPIAIAFAEKGINVVGFDINKNKIEVYKKGIDPTNEVGNNAIKNTTVKFSCDENDLNDCSFFVVSVPTPINSDHTPDLTPVVNASRIVGKHLSKNDIVVFESTVYPGVTEDVCVPILEEESSLTILDDFKVGYSPERINPGDKIHRLNNITKIVSGIDDISLNEIKKVYDLIIDVGTHPVSNIKTAEAIKVVENSQRDINIAFMNEIAMVFDKMNIDTAEVVEGMNTKWNALGFKPGLVGGHCIGVDPYYFTYEAEKLGYHSQIILNGRIVNDNVGNFVGESTIKTIIKNGINPSKAKVAIFGITFKEDCPDIRNSKVIDIIDYLNEYNIRPIVVDPWANKNEIKQLYGIKLVDISDVKNMDCIILTVAHKQFKKISASNLLKFYKNQKSKILIDVKSIYKISELQKNGISYWRL